MKNALFLDMVSMAETYIRKNNEFCVSASNKMDEEQKERFKKMINECINSL